MAQTALSQVDDNLQRVLTFIDKQLAKLSQDIGVFPDSITAENIAAADTEIDNTITQHQQTNDTISGELDGGLEKISTAEEGRIFGGDARPKLKVILKEIASILGVPEEQVQVTLVKIGGSFDAMPNIPLK